jgi:hypothetical protein
MTAINKKKNKDQDTINVKPSSNIYWTPTIKTKQGVELITGKRTLSNSTDEPFWVSLSLDMFSDAVIKITMNRKKDPYAQEFIDRLNVAIADAKTIIDKLQVKADSLPSLSNGIVADYECSVGEHNFRFSFHHPYGYQVLALIQELDTLSCRFLTAMKTALISQDDAFEEINRGRENIVNIYNIAKRYKHDPKLTWNDVEGKTPRYEKMKKNLGKIRVKNPASA